MTDRLTARGGLRSWQVGTLKFWCGTLLGLAPSPMGSAQSPQQAAPLPRSFGGNGVGDPADDEFLHRLVHDLLGPTRAVADLPLWIDEDLNRAEAIIPETTQNLMRLLAENAKRLEDLVTGLTKLSQAGQSGVPEDVDIAEMVAGNPDLIGQSIDIRSDGSPVRMPVQDMDLILSEAIKNAVRFHPTGRPAITVRAGTARNGIFTLSVVDDGPGIPADWAARAFEPFIRSPRGDRPAGAGLGLAIVDRVVVRHGGQARFLHCPPGHGACLEMQFDLG